MVNWWASLGWDILTVINILAICYFLIINLTYLVLVIISFFHIKRQYNTFNIYEYTGVFKRELYPSYSIIVPAYNEEEYIVETVRSLLQQQYGDFEIIVVNDGSKDATLSLLADDFNLYKSSRYISKWLDHEPVNDIYASKEFPNLFVLDKENGQRADAMNAGLNMARKDLFCAVDADSYLEPDVLLKMLRPFVRDEDTIAVGGIIRVANGCNFKNGTLQNVSTPNSFVSLIQVLEYTRSFLFGRTGWGYLGGLLLISGAFGVFDRSAVLNIGGYSKHAIAEDLDLTVKLHKYHKIEDDSYNIAFQPEPVCWTEVPKDWEELDSQRNRWQRGMLQTLLKYKGMLLNANYGFIGLVVMPFYFFFELLGPIIEVIGYIVVTTLLFTGLLPPKTGILFFIVAILFGILLSVVSLLCDELTYQQYPETKDLFKLGFVSVFESFGYRQLYTWWRIKGMVAYLNNDMKWDRKRLNSKVVNVFQWIGFAIINVIIVYLFVYGVTA